MGALLSQVSSRIWVPAPDTRSLEGKVFVITGGLTGIGYYTTLQLASRGAVVYAGVRDPVRGARIVGEMEVEAPMTKGNVQPFECDLSSFASTKKAVDLILGEVTRIDGLCLNAGRLAGEGTYELNSDGIEGMMQVNYFSMVCFAQALLPVLIKTSKEPGSDVRIATVSSNAGSFSSKTWTFENITSFNSPQAPEGKVNAFMSKFGRYGLSKALSQPWTRELQNSFDEANIDIIATSLHPGGVLTQEVLKMPVPNFILRALWLPPPHGALTSLFALTSPEMKAKRQVFKGKYLHPYGKITAPERTDMKDPVVARKLWNATKEVIANGGIRK